MSDEAHDALLASLPDFVDAPRPEDPAPALTRGMTVERRNDGRLGIYYGTVILVEKPDRDAFIAHFDRETGRGYVGGAQFYDALFLGGDS